VPAAPFQLHHHLQALQALQAAGWQSEDLLGLELGHRGSVRLLLDFRWRENSSLARVLLNASVRIDECKK
jgi:hypothetical protein